MHDYGFYRFEKYQNYLGYKELLQNEDVEAKEKLKTYFPNEPIFNSRDDFLTYDLCYQVTSSCFEFLGLRLKRKDIEARLGAKLIKPVLRHLGFNIPSKKKPLEIEAFMRLKLEELLENHEDGLKCSGHSCFIN